MLLKYEHKLLPFLKYTTIKCEKQKTTNFVWLPGNVTGLA